MSMSNFTKRTHVRCVSKNHQKYNAIKGYVLYSLSQVSILVRLIKPKKSASTLINLKDLACLKNITSLLIKVVFVR